jgi:TonB family protein
MMPRLLALALASAAIASAAAPALAQTPAPAILVDEQPVLLERDSVLARLQRAYPASLLESRAGGTTYVRFTVRTDGTTGDAAVERPSPHPALDSAALVVVGGMRFSPARHRGRPVAAPVTLPIAFTAPAVVAPSRTAGSGDFQGMGAEMGDGTARKRTVRPVAAEKRSVRGMEEPPRLLNRGALIRAIDAEYPPSLGVRGVGGEAVVRMRVSTEGRPTVVEILRSSGHPELDRLIARVAEQARFSPARLRDRPVASWVHLPIKVSPPEPDPMAAPRP